MTRWQKETLRWCIVIAVLLAVAVFILTVQVCTPLGCR